MRTCGNCGKRVKDNMKFCPDCGTKMEEMTSSEVSADSSGMRISENRKSVIPAGSIKLIGLTVILVIILLAFILRPGFFTVTPSEYVRVSCRGLNGKATAKFVFDAGSLEKTIVEEQKLKPAEQIELQNLLTQAENYISLSAAEGLSNGDTISIKCDMPSKYLKAFRVKVKNSDFKYTVSGLAELRNMNLEDYAVMNASGYDTQGYVSYYLEYEKLYKDLAEMIKEADDSDEASAFISNNLYGLLVDNELFALDCDNKEELSNGDKVSFTCDVLKEETGLEKYGIVFNGFSLEKEIDSLETLETLDVNPYITMQYEGYNGAGEASWEVNMEKLTSDLCERFPEGRADYTADTMKDLAEEIGYYIKYSMENELQPEEKLSNGDEVILCMKGETAGEDSCYLPFLGIILKGGEYSLTVEGLTEPQEKDLMDLVQVSFSGIVPDVSVDYTVDRENELYQYISYDTWDNIPGRISAENGDEFEITLDYDEEYALQNGYKIVNNSGKYVISGLDTYNFTLEDITNDKITAVAAVQMERLVYDLIDEENTVLDLLGESGLMLWNKTKTVLDRIIKLYSTEDDYDHNRMILVYKSVIPLMKEDETILEKNIYSFRILENVSESAAKLNWEEENAWFYSISEEAVDVKVQEIQESIWPDCSCLRTEVKNENLESELHEDDTIPAEEETEADTDTDTVNAAPVKTEEKAPMISDSAKAKAKAYAEWNGHAYYLFDEEVSWYDAEQLCKDENGTLATVTSSYEQDVIEYLAGLGDLGTYWLGATDEENEGTWVWVTGESFDYNSWSSNQPDNYEKNENYAVIDRDYNYDWNDANGSIRVGTGYILEVSADAEESGTYLRGSGKVRHRDYAEYVTMIEDTYGDRHFGAFRMDASNNGWAEFELDGEYSWFTGEISVYNEANSEISLDMAVFGDGRLLWSKCGITRQTPAKELTVDVSGVRMLTVKTRNTGEYSNGFLILDHAKLHSESEKPDINETNYRLSESYQIDCTEYEKYWNLYRDRAGYLHDGCHMFNAGKNASAAWYLAGNYERLSGKFVTLSDTGTNVSMRVKVFGDDELLYSAEKIDILSGQIPFDIDITGVNVLRIETADNSEDYNAYLYLADDQLSMRVTEEEQGIESDEEENKTDDVSSEKSEIIIPPNVTALASAVEETSSGYYFLIETPTNWTNAQTFCEQMGGRLAVISSASDQTHITNLLNNSSAAEYWLGARDEEEEDKWIWTNGNMMSYTDWAEGHPDNDSFGFILEIGEMDDDSNEVTELAEMMSEYSKSIADIYGTMHDSAFCMEASDGGWLSYDLDGDYDTFRTGIVSSENTEMNALMNMAIFGDGRLLWAENGINGWSKNKEIEVDVTGVNTLMIRTSNEGDRGQLLLYDAVLHKAEEKAETVQRTGLADLTLIDSDKTDYRSRLFRDSYGNDYDGDWCFDTSEDGYAVWLLGGNYTELSGVITASSKTGSDSRMSIQIYSDDELIFEADDISKIKGPVPFTIDVTGTRNLKIMTNNIEGAYQGYLYLTEDMLNQDQGTNMNR